VYALGCVIYACLTGRPPFVKDTPEQLMYAHNHEGPPPPRTIRPELPPAVDAVLAKSLAKDPKYRFETATALVAGLEAAFTSTSMGQTRPVPVPAGRSGVPGWLRANTPLAVIGSSLAAVALVVLVALGIGGDPDRSPSPAPGTVATRLPTPFVPPPTSTVGPITPDPNAYPNANEQTLLARLPPIEGTSTTCERDLQPYGDAIASIRCTTPDHVREEFYALFPTRERLDEVYLGQVTTAIADDRQCDQEGPPGNSGWRYDEGENVGYFGCYVVPNPDRVQYIWTYWAGGIHASWLAPDNASGLAFWKNWTTNLPR